MLLHTEEEGMLTLEHSAICTTRQFDLGAIKRGRIQRSLGKVACIVCSIYNMILDKLRHIHRGSLLGPLLFVGSEVLDGLVGRKEDCDL